MPHLTKDQWAANVQAMGLQRAEAWRNANNIFVDGLPPPPYNGPLSTGGSAGVRPMPNPVTATAPSATVPPTQGPTAVDETDNTDLSGISDFGGAGVDFTKLNPANVGAMFNKLQSQQRLDQGIQNAYAKQQQDAAQARIEKKQYGPSRAEQLFRLAAAIGKPMIRPSFGGVMANVMPELAGMAAASQKATQDRQDAIAALHQRAVEAAAERYGTSQKSQMDLVRAYGALSKPKSPRTGFNPITGALTDMDTGEPVENLPVMTPDQVRIAASDPRNRGKKFKTADGEVREIM